MVLPNTPGESEENEEAPRGGSRIAIWLIILGLGFLFLPIYLIATTIKDTSASLQTELDVVQATLSYTPPPNPTAAALTSSLAQISRQSGALDSLQSTLVAININWPIVMATIGAYDPARITMTAISQSATGITIDGQADSQNSVTAYAEMLRQSGLFEQVAVNSIKIEAPPTPIPPPTATRGPTPETPPATQVAVTAQPESIAVFEISVKMKAKTK